MKEPPIQIARDFFQGFSTSSLEKLEAHYADQVHFKDPLNEAFGLSQVLAVFKDTFKQLKNLNFHVLHSHGDEECGLLRWRMSYEMRGKSFDIDGVTELHFADDGKIIRQEDFWDASGPVYGQFPGVGLAIRGIRKLVETKTS